MNSPINPLELLRANLAKSTEDENINFVKKINEMGFYGPSVEEYFYELNESTAIYISESWQIEAETISNEETENVCLNPNSIVFNRNNTTKKFKPTKEPISVIAPKKEITFSQKSPMNIYIYENAA